MQTSPFYCNKTLISSISNQQPIQQYFPVTFQQKYFQIYTILSGIQKQSIFVYKSVRIVLFYPHRATMHLQLTAIKSKALIYRYLFNIIKQESGMFWAKEYALKLKTTYGKVKLHLKNYNQAKINLQAVLARKKWTQIQTNSKKPQIYSGMFKKIQKQKQKISSHQQTVTQSFTNFQTLFGNLRQLKSIMGSMKQSTGQNDGQNPQVNKILKDIGFMSVVSKDESGSNFKKHLASDLYNICTSTLFKTYGGMVPLLDLFYFYNKKRQLQLVSPQELVQACGLFEKMNYKARIVEYPNNIKMIQQTSFDPDKDFQMHFSQYFKDFHTGCSADQISRKKGIPLSIIQIKLRNAAKKGKLAVDDRIQGVKYYKNYFLTI